MSSVRILVLTAGLCLAACEEDYAEAPPLSAQSAATYETAQQAVQPTIIAVDYPMTQGGDVRVAAYGLVDLGTQTQTAQHLSALRVQLTLQNKSGAAWTLDTREQKIDLTGYGASVAAFASADAGSSPPSIVVQPGGRRVVDLFFPLPEQLQTGGQMPQKFDVLWRVQTGSGPVEQRTTIDEGLAPQQQVQLQPSDEGYGDVYVGPTWYNPYYPDYGFGIVVPPVWIGAPLWYHHYGYWRHPHYWRGYYHGPRYYGPRYYHGYHGGFRGGYHGGFHGGGGHHR